MHLLPGLGTALLSSHIVLFRRIKKYFIFMRFSILSVCRSKFTYSNKMVWYNIFWLVVTGTYGEPHGAGAYNGKTFFSL